MASFKNDYSVLVHPSILEALNRYQDEVNVPYGLDYHSLNAEKKILEIFNSKNGKVYFVGGGTQTNVLFISYVLKHYEGVISCEHGTDFRRAEGGDHHGIHHGSGGGQQILQRNRNRDNRDFFQK